jgi:hypothetical protein
MENKEFFSLFSEFRFEEKIEKPLELNSHANSFVSMNALNTVLEKSKLGEVSFRDFYFCALKSLVVLSFPQPLNFSSVFPSL